MAYVNGNLAVKPNQRRQEEIVIRETTKRITRKKSLPTREKLLYLFTVVLFTLIASVVIFRYTQIYDMNVEIKNMNTDIRLMNIELQQLEREVQTLSNPIRIREMAESQGMVKANDSGIVLRSEDAGQKTASLD